MTVPSDGLLPETIAERIEGDAPAVTAAADAISREYGATDGRLRSRWSRDLAITALDAAGPHIAAAVPLELVWRDERGEEISTTGPIPPGTRKIGIPLDAQSVDLTGGTQ